ncbi:MAG TPA: hypothetical protein VHN58_08355 [Croceicoccus sp.]|nr:hypothetical protein [Croceicoccus sp.]
MHNWRLVGAPEGICGIILLGWSTAYFVRILGPDRLQAALIRRSSAMAAAGAPTFAPLMQNI